MFEWISEVLDIVFYTCISCFEIFTIITITLLRGR